ncbi:MAG: regulatory protein RecX [Lachnospiraceae bacterium]|nr:regulatory protein RecX [Lachnospiraceae bacterium]
MSLVSGMVPIDKRKVKVYLDGEFAFVLYKSECARFGLEENEELTPEVFEAISGVLHKRAQNRAVYLLKDRDYTEGRLRNKLKESGYSEDAVIASVEKMKAYGYVNDYNYAESFVRNKAGMMSRRELEYKLTEKLVPRDIIRQVMSEFFEASDEDAERQAFFNLYRKKNVNYAELEEKDKQRLLNFFLRKGFSYDNIVSYLHETDKLYENGT